MDFQAMEEYDIFEVFRSNIERGDWLMMRKFSQGIMGDNKDCNQSIGLDKVANRNI